MPILNKLTGAFPASLMYITVGTLIVIWTIVTMIFSPPENYFWVVGFLVTGAALLLIGLCLGPIGRAARHAELPPPEVTAAAIRVEQTAAAQSPVIVPATAPVPANAQPATIATTPAAAILPPPQVVQVR